MSDMIVIGHLDLLAEIKRLSDDQFCILSDAKLSVRLGIKADLLRRRLSQLREWGFVHVSYGLDDNETRYLTLTSWATGILSRR